MTGQPPEARRYGGAFSPGAPAGAQPPRRGGWSRRVTRRGATRARALHLWSIPLLFGAIAALIGGEPLAAVGLGGAWGLMTAGALLTRAGVEAASHYEARTLAKPPAWPRKLCGAALTGLGLLLATLIAGYAPVEAAATALAAVALHVMAFGADPMRSKGFEGLEGEALDAALTKLETARRLIAETRGAAAATGDRDITRRVETLCARAAEVLGEIEKEPRQLRRARRFLAVWLVGARDATVAFRESRGQNDPEARARFAALIDDLDAQFARDRQALIADDRDKLDVEIDLLRDRLKTGV